MYYIYHRHWFKYPKEHDGWHCTPVTYTTFEAAESILLAPLYPGGRSWNIKVKKGCFLNKKITYRRPDFRLGEWGDEYKIDEVLLKGEV
jgi:hypothetical protein